MGLWALALCTPVDPAGVHTCPGGRGPGLESSSAAMCKVPCLLGSQDTPLRKVRVKLVPGLQVGKLLLWSVPGKESRDFCECVCVHACIHE